MLVYGHVHLFPQDHWQSCLAVKFAPAGLVEILDRYGVNLVVVEADLHEQLARRLREPRPGLVLVDEANLSAKPNPRNRLFIAVRGKQPLDKPGNGSPKRQRGDQ